MPLYDFVLAASTLAFVALAWVYVRSPAGSVFNPATLYMAFHGLVFVVRPIFSRIYEFRTIYASIGFTPSIETKIHVILAANLALFIFVGISMALAPQMVFQREPEEDSRRRAMMMRYLPAFAVLSVLCLWSLIWKWNFARSGDAITDIDLSTGGQGLIGVSGYFFSMTGFMVSLGAIFAYLNRFRWWSLIPFAVFGIIRLGIGGRGEFVVAAFVLGLLYLFDKHRKWPTALVLAAILPVYLAFSSVVSDRGAALREFFGFENQVVQVFYSEAELAPMEHMDFGNLEFFEYIVHVVPERAGTYDYFVHNLQLVTEPIPRALWPDKPLGAPVHLVDLYRYGKPIGMTMSVPGVGWFSLGYIGVAIWSAFFALVYAFAYRAFAFSRQTILATFAYMLFLGTGLIAFRDGLIMTILKQALFFAVPVLAFWASERLLRNRVGDARPAANGATLEAVADGANKYSLPAQRRAELASKAKGTPG